MAYHKVTACGRICLHRKKINISIALAGQTLGIKEVHDGIWLVSFMQYGISELRSGAENLAAPRQPVRPRGCHLCPYVRSVTYVSRLESQVLVGVAGFEPATPTSRTWFSSWSSLKYQRFSSRSFRFVHVQLLRFGAGCGAGRTHHGRQTDRPDDGGHRRA
jgi:hypothetical protein